MIRVYDEIVDFIVAGTTSDAVAQYEPSQQTGDRVADLIHKEKNAGLTLEEASDLDHYLKLEHMMRLAKARAIILLPMTSYVSAGLRRIASKLALRILFDSSTCGRPKSLPVLRGPSR